MRRHQYRYFDGAAWTDTVADDGVTATDPPVPPPPSQAAGNPAVGGDMAGGLSPTRGRSRGPGFGEAIGICFSKYADFTGRARRPEYWWFVLFTFLVYVGAGLMAGMLALSPDDADTLFGLAFLALLLPGLAVTVRRLHDTDRSGWWVLISFVPLVGPILMLIFLTSEGTRGLNRFGAPV